MLEKLTQKLKLLVSEDGKMTITHASVSVTIHLCWSSEPASSWDVPMCCTGICPQQRPSAGKAPLLFINNCLTSCCQPGEKDSDRSQKEQAQSPSLKLSLLELCRILRASHWGHCLDGSGCHALTSPISCIENGGRVGPSALFVAVLQEGDLGASCPVFEQTVLPNSRRAFPRETWLTPDSLPGFSQEDILMRPTAVISHRGH